MNPTRLIVAAFLLSHLPFAVAAAAAGEVPPESLPEEGAERKQIALDYLETLAAADWEKQKTFYTEETVFEDPTADFFGDPWHLKGPEAISEFWRTAYDSSGTRSVENDYLRLFVNGSRVVVTFDSKVRFDAASLGFPGQEVEGVIHVVTVLKIEDGKIVHHLDHADYAGAFREMDRMRAELEAASKDGGAVDPGP